VYLHHLKYYFVRTDILLARKSKGVNRIATVCYHSLFLSEIDRRFNNDLSRHGIGGGATGSHVNGSDVTRSDVSHMTGNHRKWRDRKYVLCMPGFFPRLFLQSATTPYSWVRLIVDLIMTSVDMGSSIIYSKIRVGLFLVAFFVLLRDGSMATI
jgi:hypothetical protein